MDAIPAKRLYKIPPPPEASLEHRLAQRQKQLDIGKATPEYRNYRATVPRKQRKKTDPGTPDKFQLISKRNWEGQVKAWRRRLHEWDTPEDVEEGDDEKENGGSVAKKETMASLLFKKAGAADNARPVVAASNDEDGEIPQWKLDDDRYFEQFGGHEKVGDEGRGVPRTQLLTLHSVFTVGGVHGGAYASQARGDARKGSG